MLFLSDFIEKWIFPDIFSKNTKISNLMKNPSRGSRVVPCGRADGQTDMTKLTVTFRTFAGVLSKGEKLPMLEGTLRLKKMQT
jgi:hypothetical protein